MKPNKNVKQIKHLIVVAFLQNPKQSSLITSVSCSTFEIRHEPAFVICIRRLGFPFDIFALYRFQMVARGRRRSGGYGQRCTPVSLDSYSLDNVSISGSTRRKARRPSKRSYGNPAYDESVCFFNYFSMF